MHFAEQFQDPFLRRAVPQMFTWPEIPTMVGLSLLAYLHTGNAGFPAGASLEFARAIEQRYLALGGTIHYKSQVEKILVEDEPSGRGSRAVGVRLYNDEVHRADYVISAADGREHHLRYARRQVHQPGDPQALRRPPADLHASCRSRWASIATFQSEPHWATYLLDEPLLIAGEEYHEIGVKHYCFDPSLAPAGKSAVDVMLPDRLRLLAAHLRPPAVRHRAIAGVRHHHRLAGTHLSRHPGPDRGDR